MLRRYNWAKERVDAGYAAIAPDALAVRFIFLIFFLENKINHRYLNFEDKKGIK